MTQVVIVPTTGGPALRRAVESVLAQTVPTACYVVCDGAPYRAAVDEALRGLDVPVCVLPRNVGADGFYGHRIYAAFAHLVDEDHVLFLDQDNFLAPDHVAQCVDLIAARRLQWCYSLRNICTADGEFLLRDDCESLGKWPAFTNAHLIDTNSYCLRREVLLQSAHVWHGKWGQDRVFAQVMMQNFKAFDCTGRYTVQYCLGGNEGSVTKEFFEQGNAQMLQRYKRGFPWDERLSMKRIVVGVLASLTMSAAMAQGVGPLLASQGDASGCPAPNAQKGSAPGVACGHAGETRHLEATVPDTLAQRLQPCTACHGKEGRPTQLGFFPRIAGKPAGYLYNQLDNFRAGRRAYPTMTYFVEQMSDDYLHEISDHFASLDLPYAPPQATDAPPGEIAHGEALVRQGDAARGIPACARCHGAAMTGVLPAIPGLLGLPRGYLVEQFGAWRTGQRRALAPDCMARVATLLTPADVAAVATWLSVQPVSLPPAAADTLARPLPLECGSVPR